MSQPEPFPRFTAMGGFVSPSGRLSVKMQSIDTRTAVWRDFERVVEELAKTRHPTQELLDEFRRRREAIQRELEPIFMRMEIESRFEGHETPSASEDDFDMVG